MTQVTPNTKAWDAPSVRMSRLGSSVLSLQHVAQMENDEREDLFWKQWVASCTEILDSVQVKLQQQEKLIQGFVSLGGRRSGKKSAPTMEGIRAAAQSAKTDEVAPFESPSVDLSTYVLNSWKSSDSPVEEIDLSSSENAKLDPISHSDRAKGRDSIEVTSMSLNPQNFMEGDSIPQLHAPIPPTSNRRVFAESATLAFDDMPTIETAWKGDTEVEHAATLKSMKSRHALRSSMDSQDSKESKKTKTSRLNSLLKKSHSVFAAELELEAQIENERKEMADPGNPISRFLSAIEEFQEWLGDVKHCEPERHGRLAAWVKSTIFSTSLSMVIFLDSLYTAFASNRLMEHPKADSTTAMKIIETIFVLIYFLELVVKLRVHGWWFFVNTDMRWNWFDFLLVVQALVDIVMEYALKVNGANVTFIRLIRLVKLVKILRLFKAVRFLRELRVIMVSIMNCLSALFWAFVMLALILYIFALFFVQNTSGYLVAEEGNIPEEHMANIDKFYGNVESTIMTLYQSSSGGLDWREAYDVAEKSGVLNAIGFIFFTIFFNFAVFNILSGIFIEKALAAAAPDREQQALEQRRIEEQEAIELTKLLRSMDFASTGRINLKDFMTHSMKPDAKAYLRVLGIEVHDAVMFFKVLTRVLGADDLPIEEFVNRLFKMKGTATALDLQGLSFEVTVIHKMLEEIAASCGVQTRIPQRIYRESAHCSDDDDDEA